VGVIAHPHPEIIRLVAKSAQKLRGKDLEYTGMEGYGGV
jgi:polysaccharide deacetylase 2 family uncharacterized protein YibQ